MAASAAPSAHREIVAADNDAASVNSPRAEDEVGRRERNHFAVLVYRPARQRAGLMKRSGVKQTVNAFAHS